MARSRRSTPSPFHALQHRHRQVQNPNAVVLFRPHRNGDSARLREGIRNHFELLSVKSNGLLCAKSQTFSARTNFRMIRNLKMAGHDAIILLASLFLLAHTRTLLASSSPSVFVPFRVAFFRARSRLRPLKQMKPDWLSEGVLAGLRWAVFLFHCPRKKPRCRVRGRRSGQESTTSRTLAIVPALAREA